jgi:hypothetical protein
MIKKTALNWLKNREPLMMKIVRGFLLTKNKWEKIYVK